MKNLTIIILAGLLAFMTYVAWHNSQPLLCDNITWSETNLVCEVKL